MEIQLKSESKRAHNQVEEVVARFLMLILV